MSIDLSRSMVDEWTKTQPKQFVSPKVSLQKLSHTTALPTLLPKTASTATKIGVWDLYVNEMNEFQPPEKSESLFNEAPGPPESVIGSDERKKVPKKDILPGGRCRSIVKLFLRFQGQQDGASWAMATGWLIEDDVLVTAGHCANDWSHNYGRLSHVKAYIGYSGKEAVSEANQVQMRMGIKVATTESWLTKGSTDSRGDVSFIRLNKPFTGVTPIKYAQTPMAGTGERLGVVGYPGDLMKQSTREKGALMYEMFVPTNYTLEGSKSKMLQYTIDTFGGNSGSPVLRQSDLTSIGVHVLGGNPNSASVILGKYGNSFEALKLALKRPTKGFQWVTISNTPAKTPLKPILKKESSKDTTEGFVADEALAKTPSKSPWKKPISPGQKPQPQQDSKVGSDLDIFAKALGKAKNVTTDPLGAIAAYGLHVVGMQARQLRNETETAGPVDTSVIEDHSGREDTSSTAADIDGEVADEFEGEADEAFNAEADADEETGMEEAGEAAYEGVAERAILTEAAFLTFQSLSVKKCAILKYTDRMQAYVAKHSATVGRAGTVVFPNLMPVALQVTLIKLKQQADAKKHSETELPSDPVGVEDAVSGGFGPKLDENREAILDELTLSSEADSGEPFGPEFSAIVSNGLRIPGAIVAKVATECLPDLIAKAEALYSGQEAGSEGDIEAAMADESSSEYLYDAMAQRALIGEAMLESILSTPADVQREEGIFSALRKFTKVVGKVLGKGEGDQAGQQTESFWGKMIKIGWKLGKAVYNATTETGGLSGEGNGGYNPADELTGEDEGDNWDSWLARVNKSV